jgi:rhamnose transport system ATP-binding protein
MSSKAARRRGRAVLGRELRAGWGDVDWASERARVRELLEELHLDPRHASRRMADLSLAEQQLVPICKALAQEARLVIYDEPSAILTKRETDTLFSVIRQLKQRGVATIYISHRLEEVFEIADRVTIMKDGNVVTTQDRSELTIGGVVELMAGKKLHAAHPRQAPVGAETVRRTRGLTRAGSFEDISFDVGRGEIVGFFGLIGSGATDIAHALFGIERAESGTIELEGKPVRIRRPIDAAELGIALLPKDRKTQGLFLPLPIDFNIAVGNYRLLAPLRTLILRSRERLAARPLMQAMAVKAPSTSTRAGALSGGNQQKVLLARPPSRGSRSSSASPTTASRSSAPSPTARSRPPAAPAVAASGTGSARPCWAGRSSSRQLRRRPSAPRCSPRPGQCTKIFPQPRLRWLLTRTRSSPVIVSRPRWGRTTSASSRSSEPAAGSTVNVR